MAKVKWAPPEERDLTEAAAGVPSVGQALCQEPSFTRKRRVGSRTESEIVSEGVLLQDGVENTTGNKTNRALSFRAGQRRPAPIPSEYQLQYTWKTPSDSPLLQAERLNLIEEDAGNDERETEKETGKKWKNRAAKSQSRSSTHHVSQSPHTMDKLKSNGSVEANMLGNSSSHSKSLKTHVSSRGRPSGVRQSHNRVKSRSKIKFVGQSEYRTQFKAWPITVGPSENPLAGKLKKAVQSPKKRSDITDPSLAIPYPLPDPLLEPPKSVVWGTEYSTKFKSPLGFQYVRGAWVESPKHSPTPRDPGPGERLDRAREGAADECESEEEVSTEGPISPQESLLAQLSEIRDKASEYRQRSEGSHFLPAHPTWRTDDDILIEAHHSKSPSRLSRVLLVNKEEPAVENGVNSPQSHTLTNGDAYVVDVEEEEEEDEEEQEQEGEGEEGYEEVEVAAESSSSDEERRDDHPSAIAGSAESKPHRIVTTSRDSSIHPTTSPFIRQPPLDTVTEGRVPTPVLQQSSEELVRHHLDRTTPSAGAVLTSPTLPAFVKTARSAASASCMPAKGGKRTERGVGKFQESERDCKVGDGGAKKGLFMSQASAKLKRDSSLLSSVPRSASHFHTLPKSSNTNGTRSHPLTKSTLHSLTHPPPHPSPPPSTISSLLGTIESSSSAGPTSTRHHDTKRYARKGAESSVRQPKLTQSHTHTSHTSGKCASPQCDICGAWLRKNTHTGVQVSSTNASSSLRQPLRAAQTMVGSGPHRYKGPVTQLAQELHSNKDVSSITSVRPMSNGTIYPNSAQNWVPGLNSHSVPPHSRAKSPQIDPRPLRTADELSISSLSLSSCSAASDLLKKAQERRDRFWT